MNANVAAPVELINDVWSKDDLLAAMFPASNPPQIDAVNAHYDHYRALPADQNAAGTEEDLFTTGKLQATQGRLVITIGCHSGTPVSDLLVAAGLATDWSQSSPRRARSATSRRARSDWARRQASPTPRSCRRCWRSGWTAR